MVNSVSYPGPAAVDMGPKVGTGTGQPAQTNVHASTAAPAAPQVEASIPDVVKAAAPQLAPMVPSVPAAAPLVQPLTSLALWRDGETGMQMAVVRDRVTGEVVEEFPTERARRLAAMIKAQQAMAQELQADQAGTPRLDLKT